MSNSTEKKHIIFDATILNEVQLCAARTKFNHEMNLRLPEKAIPLEEGDLLHQLMEKYYKGIQQHGTELIYSDQAFNAHVRECVEYGEQYAVLNDKNLTPSEVSVVLYQFEEYTKHYRLDGYVPEMIEEPFIVPLFDSEDLSVHMTGKIDLIVTAPNFGRCVMDHKKANRTQSPSSLSNQFSNYCFATGLNTCIVNKVGFQKTLTPEERFRRYNIFYTNDQIDRWKKNTIWWAQQYAFYIENDTWPENRTSCDKYAGCIYEPICSSATDAAREWVMKAQFVVGEPWDVTAVLNKNKTEEKG